MKSYEPKNNNVIQNAYLYQYYARMTLESNSNSYF